MYKIGKALLCFQPEAAFSEDARGQYNGRPSTSVRCVEGRETGMKRRRGGPPHWHREHKRPSVCCSAVVFVRLRTARTELSSDGAHLQLCWEMPPGQGQGRRLRPGRLRKAALQGVCGARGATRATRSTGRCRPWRQ